ncbi:uronate isomerase [Pedobacter psychrophilus]|uniref:Uronate isomerase n=1 Tax=Pedobacter psychrophilus TaxID=1826909 RepID=A0A179DGH3_9SPHI|nr:glucuronate isomerase [Pedobacter psychrophilus]OAQ39780.1 uronate isomerase [Pedobacter psychrophilus]
MLDKDFLLSNKISKELYYNIAEKLPIIDYHNHLNPSAMVLEKKFKNLTELWINDDQYKHRLMRIFGIEEKYITGNGSDKDKFFAWMETFPHTFGNPLYHWSQLEISSVFGEEIDLEITPHEEIWDKCNEKLGDNGLSCIDILKLWNTELLCTSDDLCDVLDPHIQITKNQENISVFPSLRSDSILAFDSPLFLEWLKNLENQTKIKVGNLSDYESAINIKLANFKSAGCNLSDHGLDSGFTYVLPSKKDAEIYFNKIIAKETLKENELVALKSYLLTFLGKAYGQLDMVMQLHIGAQRTTSSRLKNIAGKFGGFATIGNPVDIQSICSFLDSIETGGKLPHVIVYTLNPSDNERIATLTGSFSEDGKGGKIQFGPAWWFNDHFEGIMKHLKDVSNYSLLSQFIGMTSDSRSFLSLSRHYYFRRILCHFIGDYVEKNMLPNNMVYLSELVTKICYQNAKNIITTGKI